MRVTVLGLWHLGCVMAACLADAGHKVVGLDFDRNAVEGLAKGVPPILEPGLPEAIAANAAAGRLAFSTDPAQALAGTEVLCVAFDTPVNESDEADVAFVRDRLERVLPWIPEGTLVLLSSQVPAGFTRALASDWSARGLRFAYWPENLRLGKAIDAFKRPDRLVVGLGDPADRDFVAAFLSSFSSRIEWMSLESAEMTKHALNAFLAASVTFINELARLCETVGADAKEVERGLKSEARIGPRAYLAPGAAFAGGTLARDVRFLIRLGSEREVDTPLFRGILESNERHKSWLRAKVDEGLRDRPAPVVAVLGLTYKPGTSTLRRSSSVELCVWLHARGARVQAHDPGVVELPAELKAAMTLADNPRAALSGADLAVLATEWPEYRALSVTDFLTTMRTPRVIDQTWFLAGVLASDPRVAYVAAGRPERPGSKGGTDDA